MKYTRNLSYSSLLGLIFIFGVSCSSNPSGQWGKTQSFDGTTVDLTASTSTGFALMVMSPDCPLCITGSRDFQDLKDSFENKGIEFYGLVPGKWYNPSEVEHFVDTTGFSIPILMDREFTWSKHLKAEVTPHYYLLDSTLQVVYSGPMDDRVMRLGKKRIRATDHFFRNSIQKYLQGEAEHEYIKPTGCIIEYE
jgi:hypothetical protein